MDEAPAEAYSKRKTSRENAERRRTWRAAGLATERYRIRFRIRSTTKWRGRGATCPKAMSLHFCEECGEPIPEARRKALPGVRLCVACQEEADKDQRAVSLYNRRGSKDSQLR